MSRNELGQGLLQTGGSSTITQNFNNHYAAAFPRPSLLGALHFPERGYREHTVEAAQNQTCTWLLDTREYHEWTSSGQSLNTEHRLLWIKAKAGAGKSTLMRFAIKQARRNDKDTTSSKESGPTPKRRTAADIRGKHKEAKSIARSPNLILSHFFNARGNALEKSTEGLYRTLLVQLIQRLPHLSDDLVQINDGWQPANGQSWPIANLVELLQCAVRRLDGHAVILFVDALDECNEQEVRTMVVVFANLITESVLSQQNLRICFASRPWPDIKADKAIYLNLNDHKAHHRDIKIYIDAQLRIGISPRAENIRSRLLENSRGVFLWVKLVVAMLNKEYDRGRLENLEKRLQGTYGDLEALYFEVLNRHQDAYDESDTRIQALCFQWVLFAFGNLKPVELWWGIQLGLGHDIEAIRKRSQETDEAAMVRYISSASSGLVECVEPMSVYGDTIVQFIHESARQFAAGDGGPLSNAVDQSRRDRAVSAWIQLKKCSFRVLEGVWLLDDGPVGVPEDDPRTRLPLVSYARSWILCYAQMLQRASVDQSQWMFEIQNRNFDFSMFTSPNPRQQLHRPASLLNVLVYENLPALSQATLSLLLHSSHTAREQQHLPGLQDGYNIGSYSWMTYSLCLGAENAIFWLLDLYMDLETRHESVQNLLQELWSVWDANRRLKGLPEIRSLQSLPFLNRYTLPGIADLNNQLATFILVAATPTNISSSSSDAEQLRPSFANISCHILKRGLPNDYFDTAKGGYDDMLDWAGRRGHAELATALRVPSIRARFREPYKVGELLI